MRPEGGGKKYEYRALGALSREFDYESAKVAATEWFRSRDSGVDAEVKTISEVCHEYVTELRRKNGDASAWKNVKPYPNDSARRTGTSWKPRR